MEDVAAYVFAGGLETPFSLPADPNRIAAIAAAERILAEERSRRMASPRLKSTFLERGTIQGFGDLLTRWLK